MIGWHDVPSAAERVKRDESTIRRWIADGMPTTAGFIHETTLLERDKLMRSRRGRPRKTGFVVVSVRVAAEDRATAERIVRDQLAGVDGVVEVAA